MPGPRWVLFRKVPSPPLFFPLHRLKKCFERSCLKYHPLESVYSLFLFFFPPFSAANDTVRSVKVLGSEQVATKCFSIRREREKKGKFLCVLLRQFRNVASRTYFSESISLKQMLLPFQLLMHKDLTRVQQGDWLKMRSFRGSEA